MGNLIGEGDHGSKSDSHDNAIYTPNMADAIILIRNIQNSPKCLLPAVLMLEILSLGFCPSIISSVVKDALFQGRGNQNEVYLTLSIPWSFRRYLKFVKIEFEVVSKDQGWSSYPDEQGTRSSNTWGEVALSDYPDVRYHVYRNIHAGKQFEKQVVVFQPDHDFCQSLLKHLAAKENSFDMQLWLRSMYPGWQQTLKFAKMSVVWHFTEWQLFACDTAGM